MPVRNITRHALLAALVAAVAMLGTVPAMTRPAIKRGGHPGAGGGTDVLLSGVTTTIINDAGSSSGVVPHTFGMAWKKGDIPGCLTTNYPVPKDADTTERAFQLDDVSTWDDGSCRHASVSRFMPSISAGGTQQVQWYRRSGAYSPGTNPRTLTDVTGAHDFKMEYTDVRPCAYTFTVTVNDGVCHFEDGVLGTGPYTSSLNQLIADGIVQVVSTGPVKLGVVVHGAAVDATPIATTVTGSLTNSVTGNITVGSTTGFAASGTEMVKIDSEYVLVSRVDGTTLNFVARGAGGSTAAAHSAGATLTKVAGEEAAHLWNRWYVDIYTDPANSANVYGVSYMPLTMQPWLNVAGLDATSYHAVLKNGAATVRDWGAPVTVALSGSTVDVTNNTINLGSTPFVEGECVSFASSGTLPAGIIANRPYWGRPITGSNYRFWGDVGGATGASASANLLIDITDVGSGTLTVTRRICHPYRLGWYSAADDAGNMNWTVTRPQLRSQLTTTERQYWQTAGMMAPYDLGIVSPAFTVAGGGDSSGDTDLYRPGAAVGIANNVGQGGTTPNQGVFPTFVTAAWLRQDQTGWNQIRAAGLGKIHWPWMGLLNERTGRIPAMNNGPDGAGASYAVLGAPLPNLNMQRQQNILSGLLGPPGGVETNRNMSSGAVYVGGGNENNGNAHRSHDPYYPWLVTGLRHYLDGVYMDGNAPILPIRMPPVTTDSVSRIKQIGGTGRTYYATFIFGMDGRTPAAFKSIISGSVMGSDSNPEKTLLADYIDENLDFWDAVRAIQPAGQDVIGAMDLKTSGGDGITTRWSSVAWLWGKGITKNSRFDSLINRVTNYQKGCYEDAGGLSSYYCSIEYHSVFDNPAESLILPNTWNGAWIMNFADSFTQIGYGGLGGGRNLNFVGGGSAQASFSSMWEDMLIQDNDPMMVSTPAFLTNIPGATYTGPPEFKPDDPSNACGGNRWFYIRNPGTQPPASTTGITFDGLACTPGGAVIPVASSSSAVINGNAWVLRPQANPATGRASSPSQYIQQDRMNTCWARALGVRSDLDTAINTINTRGSFTTPFNGLAKYGIDCSHPTIQ